MCVFGAEEGGNLHANVLFLHFQVWTECLMVPEILPAGSPHLTDLMKWIRQENYSSSALQKTFDVITGGIILLKLFNMLSC